MTLNDLTAILADAQDQDRGREFELRDPVTGDATGIKLRVAGPDSATQNRAQLALSDALADAADIEGRVGAAARQSARLDSLAACVLGWEISENGEPLPFTHANVVRLLRSAIWVREQIEDFASARAAFRGEG